MLKSFLKRIKPGFVTTDLEEYLPILSEIRKKENILKGYSDNQLRQHAEELRKATSEDDNPGQLLINAFALVCETASRKLNMRPFDVQVLGAIALSEGKVIEMATGEGKTLVATMPACFHALSGKDVHVLTFNDYLAKRDANWMGDIYRFLGLAVGYIQDKMSIKERREAYGKDITYLTAKQGGFDYLRSQLVSESAEEVLPATDYAIIDEVDSILIDESRIPLVIAGKVDRTENIDLPEIATVIGDLHNGPDFLTDEYQLNIYLTDEGIKRVEKQLRCGDLYAPENEELLIRVNQALHARFLLHRDIDYILRNDTIELVDEFTGRVVRDRKWPHGLQAAIEANEGIPIREEGLILGKTTLQHYIKRYPGICGMTGTAVPAAEEFYEMYDMRVSVIPSNRPKIRIDRIDKIFPDKISKHKALIEEIKKEHQSGRPILVGTASIEESETISNLLAINSIPSRVLNAKNDEEEAGVVAMAGMKGAVTISTNMAGRGTDIKLGGKKGVDKEEILRLGGLYVIGTNRFESLRIDNQLRGRAGRQGDPGESRFFISLEDDLLQRHGIMELIPKRFRNKNDISLVNSQIIRREINRTQRIVEGKNLDIRKTLIKYATFVETQARIVRLWRREVLERSSDSLLKSQEPDLYCKLADRHGEVLLKEVERQVTLAVIDKNWTDYLEEIDLIRQGIHMVTIAGLNPYYEFQRLSSKSFTSLQKTINEEIINVLKKARISDQGIDLSKEGLKGPSSTWTYLINDNPFGDRLEIMLGGNVGFAAFAGLLYWPLLIIYFTFRKLFSKNYME